VAYTNIKLPKPNNQTLICPH